MHSEIRTAHLDLLDLLLLLVCLRLGDRSLSRLRPHSHSLVPPGSDGSQVSTDNTTLVLDGLAGSLLGNFLRKTLLVHSAVEDGPCDLSGVLALEEESFRLVGGETEDLFVAGCREERRLETQVVQSI